MKFINIAGAALALCLGAVTAQAEQYRIGLITPPPHEWTKTATAIAERIKAETEGRVDILVFPSGQLGNEAQMLQQLQTGALDFAFLTLGELANRDESYGIFLAPYIVDGPEGARELLKGEVAGQLLSGAGKFGLQGLAWGMAGMREIVMRGNAASVADLKGKKVRTVPFAQELDFWTRLGAAPTPMPLPALYDAFANGQIDGMQIDFEGTWNSKYYANAGSIIHSNHMMFPMISVASGRKWQTMSEEDRAIVSKAMTEEVDAMVGRYAGIDATYLAELQGTNVPIIEADRAFFGAAVDDWYASWRERTPLLVELEAEAAALAQ
ncbi:TRAP transporter substrate-binding protein [Paracoccus sp. S1E-3]|uniref:TRAP transporter substrate-binding protein n=1 Tax=Paracoccus sp. S1E-3 TaxID=2756130 RepID=UPI001C691D5F|nr:TRAP transporter substrate-binding protein [Paracoccus sp. S1E-3]